MESWSKQMAEWNGVESADAEEVLGAEWGRR